MIIDHTLLLYWGSIIIKLPKIRRWWWMDDALGKERKGTSEEEGRQLLLPIRGQDWCRHTAGGGYWQSTDEHDKSANNELTLRISHQRDDIFGTLLLLQYYTISTVTPPLTIGCHLPSIHGIWYGESAKPFPFLQYFRCLNFAIRFCTTNKINLIIIIDFGYYII